MGAFDVVELEGCGEAVEDFLGDAADVAALEAGVVLDADRRELGDFRAAQAADLASSAEVRQAGLLGGVMRARRLVRKWRMSARTASAGTRSA
ncbi:hypothetical protein [Streptomyces sp. NPDC058385]|uniref:hypothetical protein n=1 Tax=Streptomyces sp. NPDC058385 TaxID=3346473 RepID=UPI003651127D